MVDKYNSDAIKTLLEKYAILLEYVDKNRATNFAILIDTSINYINTNLQHLDADWKTFLIVVLKEMFKLDNNLNAIDSINSFIEYKNKYYEAYVNNIAMSVSEYYLRDGFVKQYLSEIKNN